MTLQSGSRAGTVEKGPPPLGRHLLANGSGRVAASLRWRGKGAAAPEARGAADSSHFGATVGAPADVGNVGGPASSQLGIPGLCPSGPQGPGAGGTGSV